MNPLKTLAIRLR